VQTADELKYANFVTIKSTMNELFEELRHPVVYMNFPAKRFAEIAC